MGKAVVLPGCGDVGPIHEPMVQYGELVRDTLAGVDIRFAQVERVYSERGQLQPHGGAHGRLPPHMISVITDCGFNVVSVAGNHAMGWEAQSRRQSGDIERRNPHVIPADVDRYPAAAGNPARRGSVLRRHGAHLFEARS